MEPWQIIKHCEDHLFPSMGLTVRERVLYYHLLRLTHVEGRSTALVAILPLSKSLNVAESSVREDIRSLNERGCIIIEDRSRNGHLVRVLLPNEISGIVPAPTLNEPLDLESLNFFTGRKYVTALLVRESNRCFYCLKSIQVQGCELDHVASRINGTDNSYSNIVCSCHDCNTSKQAQPADDFVRTLYRKGVLSQAELADRLEAIERVRLGSLVPELSGLERAL